jgi:hypothetical protein
MSEAQPTPFHLYGIDYSADHCETRSQGNSIMQIMIKSPKSLLASYAFENQPKRLTYGTGSSHSLYRLSCLIRCLELVQIKDTKSC